MINRFSKMRDSWFTKIILTVTALSFMSLFGVSGYIDTANRNKAVITVDNLELSQSQFSHLLQQEFSRLKALGDIDLDEDDDKKSQIIEALLKLKTNEMILDNTLQKYNIDVRDSLVGQILKLSPSYQTNGQFDYEKYRMYRDMAGKSDDEMLQDVKRNFMRVFVLDYPVAYVNVPKVELVQMAKIQGQRRTFRYLKIENAAANIDREPTEEELDQYYEDLEDELMVPETRDLTIMYIPQDKLTAAIEIPQEEIDAYYKEHIDEFEQGEQRLVMQMVFDSEDKANAAYEKLQSGEEFIKVAEENGQSADEIDLGFVSANDVSEELADVIFSLDAGTYSEPKKIADGWQILSVSETKASSKISRAEADAKIAEELRQDKVYDNNYEVISVIEDKIGEGVTMEDLATSYGEPLLKRSGINEEGKAQNADNELKDVLTDKEFLDVAFSYAEGEIGQAIETDDGIAVVRVDKINDAHKQPREDVEDVLKEIWVENERSSITQETVDNIEHDLEAGDDLATVAARYNSKLVNSRPVTRNETVDNVSFVEMKKLFVAPKDEPQIIRIGDDYIVAETTNIYDDADSIKDEKKEALKQSLYQDSVSEMVDALLKDFARGYKIKVNHNRAGADY